MVRVRHKSFYKLIHSNNTVEKYHKSKSFPCTFSHLLDIILIVNRLQRIWGACIMKEDEEVSFNIFALEYIAVEAGIFTENELLSKLCLTQDIFNRYKERINEEKRKGE